MKIFTSKLQFSTANKTIGVLEAILTIYDGFDSMYDDWGLTNGFEICKNV